MITRVCCLTIDFMQIEDQCYLPFVYIGDILFDNLNI